MAEKHKKTNWTAIIITGMLLLFLLAIVFTSKPSEDSSYTNTYDSGQNSYGNVAKNSQTISLNGIGLQRTLNYPNQEIEIDLNGQDNIIEVTKSTIVTSIDLNGIRNTINLCSTHSPSINDNGIDNKINYLTC